MSNDFFTHKRKALTDRQKEQIRNKQNHDCAACGDSFWRGDPSQQQLQHKIQYDHILPLWLGGTNELDNIQALCMPCHSKKTCQEATIRAKNDRLIRAQKEGRGRKRRGQKLQSRGFDKTHRKKMNGDIERND